jgi:hypothetical protein
LNRLSLLTFDAVDNATVPVPIRASIHFALFLLLTFHDRAVCALIESLEQFTSLKAIRNNSFSRTNEQANRQTTLTAKSETIRLDTLTTTKSTRAVQQRHT